MNTVPVDMNTVPVDMNTVSGYEYNAAHKNGMYKSKDMQVIIL